MPTKLCPIHTSRHCYCKGTTTTAKGLGWEHQKIRRAKVLTAGRCWICGEGPKDSDPFEADHVVPREYGGPTTWENVEAAHRTCNLARRGGGGRSKTARSPADLPARREEKTADSLIA